MTTRAGFADRVLQAAHEKRSWLCLGLDPELALLPRPLPRSSDGIVRFCRQLVDTTGQHVVAYKLNFAFFEALGPDGWVTLQKVRRLIPREFPVIADAKRGDIPNTARAYARAIFEALEFDAVTVNPYVGWDGVAPFASYPGKGVMVLCKTSNPGSSDIQDLPIDGRPLYLHIASAVLSLDGAADLGLVVGATQPHALREVRALSSEVVILAPGVGPQGGSAREAVQTGANERGDNILVNVSRSILYASSASDYATAAAEAAATVAAETWVRDERFAPHR